MTFKITHIGDSMKTKDFEFKKAADLQKLIEEFDQIQYQKPCIECFACGALHFPERDSFITIYGNITIGLFGGIVGNNFKQDKTLGRITCFCKHHKCIGELTHRLLEY